MIENYPENKSASKISEKENSESKQTLIDGMSSYSTYSLPLVIKCINNMFDY